MSIIAKTAQSHRTDSIAFIVINEGVAMVKHKSYILLIFILTLDNYIIFP